MKNIRFYNSSKYEGKEYENVEANIYKTYVRTEENDSFLALEGIQDDELAKKIEQLDGWKQGTGKFDDEYYVIEFEGRKYYREMDNEDDWIMIDSNDGYEKKVTYVTSIVFEPEPEYGENEPTDSQVSQYPLEDILDEFFCSCFDFYEEENEKDPVNSYIEFGSDDIEDIRNITTIIGKHVYNKEDGDYVKLIIE